MHHRSSESFADRAPSPSDSGPAADSALTTSRPSATRSGGRPGGFSPALADRVTRRHGIVTAGQMWADGMSSERIGRLASKRALVVVHRGVYRVASVPDSFEARCAAACLADPHVVITGPAAARLWGFPHVFRTYTPEVLVRRDQTPLRHGVTLRFTDLLCADDVVIRTDGIRVASPHRTWFDCAWHLNDLKFEPFTEWLVGHHCSVDTLWRTTRRFDARGRHGLARAQRVLSKRPEWQKPTDSGLDAQLMKALRRRRVTGLVRGQPIRLPNGMWIHPDLHVPEIGWAVEIDHVSWHGGRFETHRDAARRRSASVAGWQIECVTDRALNDEFDDAIAAIVDGYRCRRDS